MSENKKRRHAITEKTPLLAIAIWIIVAMLLQSLGGIIVALTGVFGSNVTNASYAGIVIGAVLFLIIMKAWYKPEYKGVLKSELSSRMTFLVTLPIILYSIVVLVYQLIVYKGYWNPTFTNLLQAMSAGFGEETMLRASMIPIAMGFFKSKKRVWAVPVITGILFGLAHLANIGAGASVFNGVVQAAVTAMNGIYYGVLFVCTGSVVPGIIMHSIYDFICFAGDPTLTNGVMTSVMPVSDVIFNLAIAVFILLAGCFILKKTGTADILKIWKKKWSHE